MKLAMYQVFDLMPRPEVVNQKGIGTLFVLVGQHVGLALAPVVGACFVAGLAAAAGQVGLKPTPEAIKPDFKKINPVSGMKQMFNPQHLAFETAKNLVKTAIVAAIAAHALFSTPRRAGRAGRHAAAAADPRDRLDGHDDRAARGDRLHRIAIVDYAYQRYRSTRT